MLSFISHTGPTSGPGTKEALRISFIKSERDVAKILFLVFVFLFNYDFRRYHHDFDIVTLCFD